MPRPLIRGRGPGAQLARVQRYAIEHARPMPAHAPHLKPFTITQQPAAEPTTPAAVDCKAIVLVRPELYLTDIGEQLVAEWEGAPS